MFTRINLAAACCLLLSAPALSQTGVDFRDAVRVTAPATVAVMLDADAVDSPLALRYVLRARGVYAQPVNSMFEARQLAARATPTRVGFAVAPDLVISCEIPTSSQEFVLVTHDGHEVQGRVVVRDHVTGIAAIRINGASLSTLEMAAEAPQAGLPVIISWLQDGKTFTSESSMIATASNSDESDFGFSQKLDMSITPDKSGAPIVDGRGTVLGVALGKDGTAICLPVTHLARIIEAASADEPSDLLRGRLGIQINDAPDGSVRALIIGVADDMPAKEAGLQAGDRVIKISGRPCTSHLDVMAAVAMSRAGDEITLEIGRGDETFERTIRLSPVGSEPRRVRFKASPTGAVQQVFQLEDGKLVPIVKDTPGEEAVLAKPQAFLYGFQVERSELEQSLKKLEAENARLKKLVDAINETLNAGRSKN